MGYNIYELALIAVILIGIGFVVWRSGQANPVPTGKIDREVMVMRTDLTGLSATVKEIEERVEDIDKRAAKKSDIQRLEKQLSAHDAKIDEVVEGMAAIREQVAAKSAAIEHTRKQVDRLYDVLIPEGLKKS